MNSNIILIPIYKTIIDTNELLSINQCIKVLYNHPISIFTYRDLDISNITELMKSVNITYWVEYFEKEYFENIAGYNRLMLSTGFYKRFKEYEFILIYQLDAWVFRDELEYWCNQDYDYIGAPWFEGWVNAGYNSKITGAGNGGFSLRNVAKTIQLLNQNSLLLLLKNFFTHLYRSIFHFKTYKSQINFISITKLMFSKNKNEDYYLVEKAKLSKRYKVAPPEVAMHFAFDANPERLYELTGERLPFGCHAWNRYAANFWGNHIPMESSN